MNILVMSFRNIFRHKRRAFITELAICFGVLVIIFFGGFITALERNMLTWVIQSQTGHVQLHHKGYLASAQNSPYDYLISDYDLLEKKVSAFPEVKAVSSRVKFGGMAAKGPSSAPFSGIGIEPQGELMVTANQLADEIIAGEYLQEDDAHGILIGVGLARSLKAGVGDKITLIISGKDDSLNVESAVIRGIIRFGQPEIDNMIVYTSMKTAQHLLWLRNDATEVVVLLPAIVSRWQILMNQEKGMKRRNKTNRLKAALKRKNVRSSLRKSKGERKYPS